MESMNSSGGLLNTSGVGGIGGVGGVCGYGNSMTSYSETEMEASSMSMGGFGSMQESNYMSTEMESASAMLEVVVSSEVDHLWFPSMQWNLNLLAWYRAHLVVLEEEAFIPSKKWKWKPTLKILAT